MELHNVCMRCKLTPSSHLLSQRIHKDYTRFSDHFVNFGSAGVPKSMSF